MPNHDDHDAFTQPNSGAVILPLFPVANQPPPTRKDNNTMKKNTHDARRRLIAELEDAAAREHHEAAERPDDPHHECAASTLEAMAGYVAGLAPSDHRLLTVAILTDGWGAEARFLADTVSQSDFHRPEYDPPSALNRALSNALRNMWPDKVDPPSPSEPPMP